MMMTVICIYIPYKYIPRYTNILYHDKSYLLYTNNYTMEAKIIIIKYKISIKENHL